MEYILIRPYLIDVISLRNWSSNETSSMVDMYEHEDELPLLKSSYSTNALFQAHLPEGIKSYEKKDNLIFSSEKVFDEDELSNKKKGSKCSKCTILENQIKVLKKQEAMYESFLKLAPEVQRRLEELKNANENKVLYLNKPVIKITPC